MRTCCGSSGSNRSLRRLRLLCRKSACIGLVSREAAFSAKPAAESMRRGAWTRFLAVFGPGLVVMLADSDVGSIVTAGQSGAQWGYRLLGLQFVLMPVLYLVQELTVRLGIFTGRGHGELVREAFGRGWALVVLTG